jgi:hypothetical protein
MKIKNTLQLNTYAIISEKIEEGINWGWQHAHKHSDKPNEATIKDYILNDIMNSLSEIIKYETD